jgi:hypothetical protein
LLLRWARRRIAAEATLRIPFAVALLLIGSNLSAQTAIENNVMPAAIAVQRLESAPWDLARCHLATPPTAGHLCSQEHLDADLALLAPNPQRNDLSAQAFLRTMAEIGFAESMQALKASSESLEVAQQNLADFEACLSDNYRSLGFRAFEKRKQAASRPQERKKIDREELDWFRFYGADHDCTPEHWEQDFAILIARDIAHARDPKWQTDELRRQAKTHVSNPAPLADPTTDPVAREKLRREAVLGRVEQIQGDARLKQVKDERAEAIWSAVAAGITAAANGYAAAVAPAAPAAHTTPTVPSYVTPAVTKPLPVYSATALSTYTIPAHRLQPFLVASPTGTAATPMPRLVAPRFIPVPASPPSLIGVGGTYLGALSGNPYNPNSVNNPFGKYGSPYSPTSINNPYGKYGSPYSPTSITNPYTTKAPAIVATNGQYLGQLSANPYSPTSVRNPYGVYGSPYSPTSITNPYGPYGTLLRPSFFDNAFTVSPVRPIPVLAPVRH